MLALLPPAFGSGATFTVTTTADDGPGSLRQAIVDANASPGADLIAFGIPGAGVRTIAVLSALPLITDAVVIDGTTQPGFSGVPIIELDGGSAGPGLAGLDIAAGGSTVRALVIGSFSQYGIRFGLAGGNVVEGCYVGTDATGNLDRGDGLASILITGGSSGNRIGGLTAPQSNVLSGSAAGLIIEGPGKSNLVQGNFVGTDASGTASIAGSIGVIVDAADVTLGGPEPGAGNVISGHSGDGIQVHAEGNNAVIRGNKIGTDVTGLAGLPNTANGLSVARASGVRVTGNVISGNGGGGVDINGSNAVVLGNLVGTDASGTLAPLPNGGPGVSIERDSYDNVVGSPAPGDGNVIAYNLGGGVVVSSSPSAPFGSGNAIRGNAIYGNAGLGIDLIGLDFLPGPTPNDAQDADAGPNEFQNFPLITAVEAGSTSATIQGVLGSTPAATFDLDFYASSACTYRPRDFIQGETYVGSTSVVTDGAGNAAFSVTLPVALSTGTAVSATATNTAGSTSEFSQRIVFSASPASGPASGGSAIAISGTNFLPGMTVTVGGLPPLNLVVESDTAATATVPAFAPGVLADVVAVNPDGTHGTLGDAWLAAFLDVPAGQMFHSAVTALVTNGISAGCGGGNFCVDASLTRAQIAPLLLRARNGLCFTPAAATGTVFADVAIGDFAADWIEALAAEGLTDGCGGGDYCPSAAVTRAQMAVFLLKAQHGTDYLPPSCAGIFGDVPCPGQFADWIEQLYGEGITHGCDVDPLLYCPSIPTARGQAAAFLTSVFDLD